MYDVVVAAAIVSVAVEEVGNVAAMVVVELSCYLLGEEVVGALCQKISMF